MLFLIDVIYFVFFSFRAAIVSFQKAYIRVFMRYHIPINFLSISFEFFSWNHLLLCLSTSSALTKQTQKSEHLQFCLSFYRLLLCLLRHKTLNFLILNRIKLFLSFWTFSYTSFVSILIVIKSVSVNNNLPLWLYFFFM